MKMKNVIVENLHHPSPGIRRASIKTVQDLQITSNQAVEGIVSCLIQGSNEMQQDALSALSHLLGRKMKHHLFPLGADFLGLENKLVALICNEYTACCCWSTLPVYFSTAS